jgi:1,4-dihydroxy-2-naphthoate polyprenyltransferase
VLIALGALAIVAALAYTGGPWPYGYRPWARCSCSCSSASSRSSGRRTCRRAASKPLFFAAALPPGALITAILVVNNLRDIPTDAVAGKRTLAVVMGKRATQREYALLLAVAYLVPVAMVVAGLAGITPAGGEAPLLPFVLLPLLTLPIARPLLATVMTFGEPRELNLVLKGTARLSFLHGMLFAAGLGIAGAALGGLAG